MTDVTPDLITAHAAANPDKIAIIDDRPGQQPRQITPMNRSRATKGQKGELARIEAALDGYDPDRAKHVVVDDL